MNRMLTFQQALEQTADSQRNLLLGNGFSIACEPSIFNYTSLYAKAAEKIGKEMPEAQAIFEKIGTKDFEAVIRMLNAAEAVLPHYLPKEKTALEKLKKHGVGLKAVLLSTIAENHPEFPGKVTVEKFAACRNFLGNFIHPDVRGRVYTLNYDLLLYWALMHSEADGENPIDLVKNDGFGKDDPGDDYIVWVNEDHSKDQKVFYLHGAIHLFDSGTELEKYTWINRGIRLIDQAREALRQNKFPLFVAEGESAQKLERIRRHPYLHHCYKSFLQAVREGKGSNGKAKPLFVFGHSLAENDDHILSQIGKGSISQLYLSIYGDPNSDRNKQIIRKAQSLRTLRGPRVPLEVNFFDAESAEVWGKA